MNSTVYAVDEYGNEAEDIRSGYIGEIKMFGYAGVPEHCLACDGSLLSITAYPELYAKLGTQHGGDGVTTFALPTAEDVIYAAGNGRAVGAAVADGLPDINGEVSVAQMWLNQPAHGVLWGGNTGALNVYSGPPPVAPSGMVQAAGRNETVEYYLRFLASRANSIYGASTHVQPKGTAFNFCIVYE